MAKVKYQVEVYHKDAEGNYSTTPDYTFTNSNTFSADASIEAKADGCTLSMENIRSKSGGTIVYSMLDGIEPKIKSDDKVVVYLKSGTVAFLSSDIIFNGLVNETTYDLSVDGRKLIFKLNNLLNSLTKSTYSANYGVKSNGDPWYPQEIIQNLIGHANDFQIQKGSATGDSPVIIIGSTQVEWDAVTHYENGVLITGNANITTQTTTYSATYKPIFEMIAEVASQKINGVANLIYWLDATNHFVCILKPSTSSATFTEGRDFNTAKVGFKVSTVTNAMIVSGGKDCYGNTILAYAYNQISAAELGLKWHSGIEVNDVAKEIKGIEKAKSNWGRESSDSSEFPLNYPWTFSFKTRKADGTPTSTTATATSDSTYNEAIKTEARWQISNWAQSIVDMGGSVQPTVEMVLDGVKWESGTDINSNSLKVIQGDKVTMDIPSYGITGSNKIDFRVKAITHIFNTRGWNVTLNLETDVEDVISITGH